VVITDKNIGVSQLSGSTCQSCPLKVYAYVHNKIYVRITTKGQRRVKDGRQLSDTGAKPLIRFL